VPLKKEKEKNSFKTTSSQNKSSYLLNKLLNCTVILDLSDKFHDKKSSRLEPRSLLRVTVLSGER